MHARKAKNVKTINSEEARQRYGLRKLSVGVASVLLSSTAGHAVSAHAEVVTANSNSVSSEGQEKTVATNSGLAISSTSVASQNTNSSEGQKKDKTPIIPLIIRILPVLNLWLTAITTLVEIPLKARILRVLRPR